MDDWTRLHVQARLRRSGYTDATLVAESGVADATLVAESGVADATLMAFEAKRDARTALIGFGFERLDDGELMSSGTVGLPYPEASAQPGAGAADPWLVVGGWEDLDPDRWVVVGKLRDSQATRCTTVTTVSSIPLPVSSGVVVGWVESAHEVVYDVG